LSVVSLVSLIWINALAQSFPGSAGLSAAYVVSLFTNNINLKVMGLPTGGDDTSAVNSALSAAGSTKSVYARVGHITIQISSTSPV